MAPALMQEAAPGEGRRLLLVVRNRPFSEGPFLLPAEDSSMLQPSYTSLNERPRAVFLRTTGMLLLVAGLTLNIWLLVARAGIGWKLGLMILAPGLILLFAAFLAEKTPSMRGCLSVGAVLLAFMAAFWAWVGVTVALSPTHEPPEMLRPAPVNEPIQDTDETAPENEAPTGGG